MSLYILLVYINTARQWWSECTSVFAPLGTLKIRFWLSYKYLRYNSAYLTKPPSLNYSSLCTSIVCSSFSFAQINVPKDVANKPRPLKQGGKTYNCVNTTVQLHHCSSNQQGDYPEHCMYPHRTPLGALSLKSVTTRNLTGQARLSHSVHARNAARKRVHGLVEMNFPNRKWTSYKVFSLSRTNPRVSWKLAFLAATSAGKETKALRHWRTPRSVEVCAM